MLDLNKVNTSNQKQLSIDRGPLFDLLFQEIPDALFILDSEDFSVLESNEKAVELFEAENITNLKGFYLLKLFENELSEFSRNRLEMNFRNRKEYLQELAVRTLKQNIFWGRLHKRSFESENKEYILLQVTKTVNWDRPERLSSVLLHGTAHVTGYRFFRELTRLLCNTFNVGYAFIGKISDDKKYLNIMESSGELPGVVPNRFVLEDKMFENAIRSNSTLYNKSVREIFPEDEFLSKGKINGFIGTPILGTNNEVIGLIGLMDTEPITELDKSRYILSILASRTSAEIQRIRTKEILKDQVQILSDSNEAKDKLLSVLSHDLINPLHTIMGFSEMLRNKIDKYEKDKIIERVEIIDNSIRNIYFLLDNLTCWSNSCRNNVKLSREFLSIEEVIEENLSLFKYIIEIKDIRVTTSGNAATTIYCDKKILNSIVRNILSNAVKFSPKHGKIEFKIKENRSNISISIIDNGIGITEDEIRIIHKAVKDSPELLFSGKKSKGLGLLLSHSLAERIGGSMKINSSTTSGTTVIITIPRG